MGLSANVAKLVRLWVTTLKVTGALILPTGSQPTFRWRDYDTEEDYLTIASGYHPIFDQSYTAIQVLRGDYPTKHARLDLIANGQSGYADSTIEIEGDNAAGGGQIALTAANINLLANVFISGNLTVTDGVLDIAQLPGWLPFASYDSLAANPASGAYPYCTTIGRSITLVSWHQRVNVVGTNDASNYWLITMQREDTWATVAQLSTQSQSLPQILSTTTFATNPVTTTQRGLYIQVTKVGNPGALYLAGPMIYGK